MYNWSSFSDLVTKPWRLSSSTAGSTSTAQPHRISGSLSALVRSVISFEPVRLQKNLFHKYLTVGLADLQPSDALVVCADDDDAHLVQQEAASMRAMWRASSQ
jgi:hypothetical protein